MDSKGNPILAVDAIIRMKGLDKIVLVQRKYEPHGWALPGGIVDEGESCEHAVVREAKEETGLDVKIVRQFHVYSDPQRDPRKHVVSVVFICDALSAEMRAASDAVALGLFDRQQLGAMFNELCFDHGKIVNEYLLGMYFDGYMTGARPDDDLYVVDQPYNLTMASFVKLGGHPIKPLPIVDPDVHYQHKTLGIVAEVVGISEGIVIYRFIAGARLERLAVEAFLKSWVPVSEEGCDGRFIFANDKA